MKIYVAYAEENGKIIDMDIMSRLSEWLDFQCEHLGKGYIIEHKGTTLNGYWL